MYDHVFQVTEEFLDRCDRDRVSFFEKDKWYFWDETEDANGPFNSEDEARIELKRYCDSI